MKEGVTFLNDSDDKCPFCQQKINEELKEKIQSFFDDTYNDNIRKLEAFKAGYRLYVDNIIKQVKDIAAQDIDIIDHEQLKGKIKILEEMYRNNCVVLDNKIKSPSTKVALESIENTLKEIAEIVDLYIKKINENNDIVLNIRKEKEILKSEIWRFVTSELETDYKEFSKIKIGLQKGIKSIEDSIMQTQNDIQDQEKQIREKEADITSVASSVHFINQVLRLYGYTGFKLAESEKKGYYKINRKDGTDARETLSEGEYNFITFLYFYSLLKGSLSSTGITADRVVVIDDPISSLDSNALFIVSNLIKEVITGIKEGLNKVKQIFILTHNVYFFKEVTYRGSRERKWKEEAYWTINKVNNKSAITRHDESPIQTSYELLWREIEHPVNANKITIFNTLRRILEYYFKILGGIEYEKVINNFDGEEQIVCRSLVSWINDGSHFIHDDMLVNVDAESVERYLRVFKLIFEKMGHEGHYNMMTRRNKAYEEESDDEKISKPILSEV